MKTIIIHHVLINTKPEHEHTIYNKLAKESDIIEIKPLFREYDMIATVKSKNPQRLGRFIQKKIRSLDGVVDTKILQ